MDRIIEVKINGNYLTKDNKNAGVVGEANATALRIEFDEGWDGYAKTITWIDARGENPTGVVLTYDKLESIADSTRVYLTLIPGEVLTLAGEIMFAVDGYLNGKRQRSVYGKLVVRPGDVFTTLEDVTPSQAEQLQTQIEAIMPDLQASAQASAAAIASASGARASETAAGESAASAGRSAAEAAKSAQEAAVSAESAQEYSGNPPIIQNATWWTWDANTKTYVDTEEPANSVAVEASGLWGVEVVGDDLVVGYTGEEPPPLRVEDGALVSEFDGVRVNLGNVRGPVGDTGPQGETGDSGVYVGSGTPPAGCRVQVDPNGGASNQEIAELLADETAEVVSIYANQNFANALKGTAQGASVTLDDVSPLEHTIPVKVRSKNFVDYSKISGYSGDTVSIDGNVVTLAAGNNGWGLVLSGVRDFLEVGKTYTFSFASMTGWGDTSTEKGFGFSFYYRDGTTSTFSGYYVGTAPYTITFKKEVRGVYFRTGWGEDKAENIVITGIQIEEGSAATEYTPFVPDVTAVTVTAADSEGANTATHNPAEDGSCEVASIAPSMVLTTDNENTVISCEYNRDINKAYDQLVQAILSMGGNI